MKGLRELTDEYFISDQATPDHATPQASPKVERLAHSGLYINPSDALKYLSNQLSWVSSNKGSTENSPLEEKPGPTQGEEPAGKKNQETSEASGQEGRNGSSPTSQDVVSSSQITFMAM